MAITASTVSSTQSLEEFRLEFNKLQSDVTSLKDNPTYGTSLIFEGSTEDANEVTLAVADPTADRTVTIPDATGTMVLTGAAAFAVGDGGTIGSDSDADSMTIAADGVVTFSQAPVITEIDSGSTLTLDAADDITLDADGGDVFLKDGGSTFGSLTNTSGNLIIKSGTTTAATFSGANVTFAGTIGGGGTLTTGGNIVIPDAGNIGSASDTDAVSIASTGAVTFSQRPVMSSGITVADGGQIGSASDLNAITISSGGVVAITATTANTSASDGALTVAGGLGVAADVSIGDDLRLISDSAVLSFGADSDVTLTHDPDDGLVLKSAATADNNPFLLTIQTGETDIAADDVIGTINFQAPDEGEGTDSRLVAAGIEAVSEGDFSASSNATKLSFKTGASEAAAEKMSLSSAGVLTVSGAITSSGVVTGTGFTIGSAAIVESELEMLDGITAGTAAASKAVVLDSNGDIVIADSDKWNFGTGSDMILYHDGSNSYITNKTGALKIATETSGIAVTIGHSTSEVTVADNLTVTGNLTVSGTQTVVDTVTMNAANAIVFEGSTADAHETTLTITDPTADRTITLPNTTGTVLLGTLANPGSADGAALGSASLEWSDLYLADSSVIYFGNDQDTTLTHTDGTGLTLNSTNKLTFGDAASFIHQSSDGVMTIDGEATIDLNASTAVLVSNDLKLNSDSAVLTFGADSEITVTHVADEGLNLKHTATADDKPIILTLQTGETDMQANDIIGALQFQAPDEGEGTDSRLVSAAIKAYAEGNHSASSNATTLGFYTGASETAAIKMYLDSAGVLTMSGTTDSTSTSSGQIVTHSIGIADDAYIGDLLSVAGDIYLAGSNKELRFYEGANYVGFEAPALSADQIWVLPNADGSSGEALVTDGSGNLSYASNNIGNATTFTASANNSANETVYPVFVDGATGEQGAETDTALTYNPSSGLLSTAAITLTGALTVGGTTTLNGNLVLGDAAADTLTIGATLQGASPLIFEGATADGHETTFAITDPTGDRTITFPDSTGTVLLSGGNLAVGDDGTIGSASDADAIAISSAGVVSFSATTEASATGTAAVTLAGGLGVAKDMWIGDDIVMDSDSAVLKFGDDQDTTLTHTDGTGLTLNSTNKLTFGDTASFVQQSSDGVLRIDGEATVDINASTAVLVSNDLKLDSDAAVLGFGVNNDVTLTHVHDTGVLLNSTRQIQFGDSASYIAQSSDGTLRIDGEAIIDLNASTRVDVSTDLKVGDDLNLASDSAAVTFGGDSEIAITHLHNQGLSMTSTHDAPLVRRGEDVFIVLDQTAADGTDAGDNVIMDRSAADTDVGDDIIGEDEVFLHSGMQRNVINIIGSDGKIKNSVAGFAPGAI